MKETEEDDKTPAITEKVIESDISDDDVIDDEYFKCAASDLCGSINSHDWRSGMLTKQTKGIKLCSDCRYHAHANCLKKFHL